MILYSSTLISDFHCSNHCKMKALWQKLIRATKVKTRSFCAHDDSLMHAQTDIILNSFSFISIFLHICYLLHHPNASVPVGYFFWMADHPSMTARHIHVRGSILYFWLDVSDLITSRRNGTDYRKRSWFCFWEWITRTHFECNTGLEMANKWSEMLYLCKVYNPHIYELKSQVRL